MNSSIEPSLSFYQKTGELFYAVAAADNVVRKSEFDRLKKMIQTEWKGISHVNDEFGTDAAYQMEIIFDWLDYESLNADQCFDNFRRFYTTHKTMFTEKYKKLILKTAHSIANAFAGKNKSELAILGSLQLLFKN